MLVTIIFLLGLSGVELLGLLELSESISSLNTISIIMLTFLVGVVIARSYGKEFFEKLQWHLKSRSEPSHEALNGAVMVAGSYCLITPGPLTDFIGLFILIPATRIFIKDMTLSWMNKKIANGDLYFFYKD